MSLDDGPILLLGPPLLLDVRVEMVVPSLPALFANPAGEVFGDVGPIFGAVLHD